MTLPDTGRRRGRRLLKVAVFILTLAVALTVFEVICRVAKIDFNPNQSRRFHPSWGWTQERSKQFKIGVEGRQVQVQFNALGFRDVEHTLQKPAGTKRLLVLGDSFSEALQVNLEETYWYRLGQSLNFAGSGQWEVINLASGDWGTAQEYRALIDLGLQYQPDLVLLQFFSLNDVCNNAIELAGLCFSDSDSYRPYYVQTDRGLELAWSDPSRQWLRGHVVSFGVLEKVYQGIRKKLPLSRATRGPRRLGFRELPIFETFVPGADQLPVMSRAWQTTDSLLKLVDKACRERGIQWFPVIFPHEIQLRSKWPDFERTIPRIKASRDYPDRRLGELAGSLGTTSVSLLPTFDEHDGEVLPYVDGHLNRAAHQLVAQTIYAAMVGDERASAPTHLQFGAPATRIWMRQGWSGDERFGENPYVWSDGPRSQLELPLPTGQDVRLDFSCEPFTYPGSPTQTVSIVLNGTTIHEVALGAGVREYSAVLPKAAIHPSTNTMEFVYGYAKRPNDVRPNAGDSRQLGVAWHSIDLTPVKK